MLSLLPVCGHAFPWLALPLLECVRNGVIMAARSASFINTSSWSNCEMCTNGRMGQGHEIEVALSHGMHVVKTQCSLEGSDQDGLIPPPI